MNASNSNIIILCRNISDNISPFNSDYYRNAYVDLLLAIKSHGGNAYFSTREQYQGNGIFKTCFTTTSRAKVSEFTVVKDVTAAIVYNKGDFSDVQDIPVLNPSFVHKITSNKHEMYRHFPDYQPLSLLCESAERLDDMVNRIPGERIVLKSLTGNGGHGVRILKRAEYHTNKPADAEYPILIQEFMDTSVGIPGMAHGIHDLRVKMGDGEVWAGTLRIPADGELRANVAQGGSEKHLFPSQIPSDAVAIAKEIDAYFGGYSRYYSIDLARTGTGWKLIELNSKPGLSPVDMSEQSKHTTNCLAQYLVKLGNQSKV